MQTIYLYFILSFWRYAPGLYWNITWPPLIQTSALKIVPQVYIVGFVKCFDIAVHYILFHFESVRSIVNQRKDNNIFTGLNVFFKALNSLLWQVSQSFDFYPHHVIVSCLLFLLVFCLLMKLRLWRSVFLHVYWGVRVKKV